MTRFKASLLLSFFFLLPACIPQKGPSPKDQVEIKPQVPEEEIPPEEEPTEVETVVQPKIPASKKQESNVMVKIGLRSGVQSVKVISASALTATDRTTGNKEKWNAGTYVFTAKSGKLLVNNRTKSSQIRLTPSIGNHLMFADKSFRGTLIVKAEGSNVILVNELRVDEYLKGVLPREVVISWHLESLKVQAVASRTYLASHLGRHASEGFDLCSDVHCQVYGGMTKESEQTNKAVEQTAGEILIYNGKPIGAFFHSNCGGETEQIDLVWGYTSQPYLVRRRCAYGTADPRYNWSLALSNENILNTLVNKGLVKGHSLKSVRIKTKSPSGRAQTVEVETDQETVDMKGNDFRIALNPEKIRSTLWTSLARTDDGYRFDGRGWGHGVGMCQWGAKGQAEQGRGYKTILSFYYPGSKLTAWSHR